MAVGKGILKDATLGNQLIHVGRIALVSSSLQVFVESPDILAAETLDDQDDHVLAMGLCLRGGMDGVEDLCGLFDGCVIVGDGEDVLANGAQQGKGSVQHQCRLLGPLHPLVGVADRDGAHTRLQSSSDAGHTAHGSQGQGHEVDSCEAQPLAAREKVAVVRARGDVEVVEGEEGCHAQQYEHPVIEDGGEEDASEVVLIIKFAENAGRRASHRERVIDRVGQVDGKGQPVDHHEDPALHLVPQARFLQPQGEEHQHEPQGVDVEDDRGVKKEAASEDACQVAVGQRVGKERAVFHEEGHTGQDEKQIGYQQVEDYRHRRPEITLEYLSHRYQYLMVAIACVLSPIGPISYII